eukprot:TRINITY_DN2008_c0_g1_i1.p1 TRINITY_DN2008_c0_g1~~TRINITY_DN2008_c0_g1_i1.p1  ORF type:complete len:468 (-),score=147.68 TRINITY_DN2008_c0_g1_i1:177-1580(-)
MADELPQEVLDWLKSINLMRYADAFGENGYDDLEVIAELNDDDLNEIKVLPGHRKKILMYARQLKEGGAATGQPASQFRATKPAVQAASARPKAPTQYQASPRQYNQPKTQIQLSSTQQQAAGINRPQQQRATDRLTGAASSNQWAQQTTTGNQGYIDSARRKLQQQQQQQQEQFRRQREHQAQLNAQPAAGISRRQQDRATDERLMASQGIELPFAAPAGGGAPADGVYGYSPSKREQRQAAAAGARGGGQVAAVKYAAPDGMVDPKSNTASLSNPLVPAHKVTGHRQSQGYLATQRVAPDEVDVFDARTGEKKYVQYTVEPGTVDAKSNLASADNPLAPVHKATTPRSRRAQLEAQRVAATEVDVFDARTGEKKYVQYTAEPGTVDAKSNVASADNPLAPVHKVVPQRYQERNTMVRYNDGADTQVYADARDGKPKYVQFASDVPDPKSNTASTDNPLVPKHRAW